MKERSPRFRLAVGCLLVLVLAGMAGARPPGSGTRVYTYDPGPPLESFQEEGPTGDEVVYLDQANKTGSLSPDSVHTQKCDLYYTCLDCRCLTRVPKKCTCGKNLQPCVRIGQTWFGIRREAGGFLFVESELHQAPLPRATSAKRTQRTARQVKPVRRSQARKPGKTAAPSKQKQSRGK
ncbi:MAG: hypothetical protein OZSIB_3363 [Candidatus Ozemobacter sibiricus]|jgi:hypothetical protein|uniref:Uncharacterized protein n=1 Tax=Candidatus Ozemobacter sibiricus TaxID=2268124 RepID=A0A367Z3W1_9BACT|nr:MAG: hypothetical protein OZSIB_3363 [Candidatus Ozemobacter sibiricus]